MGPSSPSDTCAGATYCWEHSRGQWRKWASLTRNQSISFILTVFGAVGVSSDLPLGAIRLVDARQALAPRDEFALLKETGTGAPGVNVFFQVEGAPADVVDSFYRLVVTGFPGDD